MSEINCARCGKTREGFERAPFPGKIGERVQQQICTVCWSEWNRQQMMLINHYGLNLMDPQARQFLTKNMEAFLFRAGEGEQVDTSKQGTSNW